MGDPERLPFFLNQVWAHLNCYASAYPNDSVMVNVIATNLEGEVAEWVTSLHNEQAPELRDVNLFMGQLRARFEDEFQALQAEIEIRSLKLRGQPTKEYVWEFWKIAGRIREWSERSLIHYFKEGLDHDLFQACTYWGIPDPLREWY